MQPAQPSTLEMFFPFVIVIFVMYFWMIRPQSKKTREHETFLKSIKRGDQVITSAGVLGTIDGMTDQFVTLEIASGVKIKMLRNKIASTAASVTAAPTAAATTTDPKKA